MTPRIALSPLLSTVLFLLSAGVCQAAPQQEPPSGGDEIRVILEGRQRSYFRLAIPTAGGRAGLGGDLLTAGEVLEDTLRSDLAESRVFTVQGPEELAILTLTGDQSRDFELYRSLGNELLLLIDLGQEAGRLVVEARVFDLESGRALLGKRYRGTPAVARRIAHTLADEIVLFFSGRRGVSLTSIVFSSDRSGFKELYLMDYDGANQRAITAHKSISMFPAWSPSAREIAYVSYFSGAPRIYVVDLATGRKRPIVEDNDLNISPSFSPDGRRIAFARTVGGGNTEIFSVATNGGDLRRLTQSSAIDTNPVWSPSGRELAFTSSRAGSPQIYVMDAEGANLRRVSFDGDYNDGASWSPDGTRLVYATRRGGAFSIAVTDMVTLETRLLVTGQGSHETPSFSPDGKRIVFSSKRPGGQQQIFVVDADGANLRQLTRDGNNSGPSWSGFPP